MPWSISTRELPCRGGRMPGVLPTRCRRHSFWYLLCSNRTCMSVRQQLHKLVDDLDDAEVKPDLHALIDRLNEREAHTALTAIRALRRSLGVERGSDSEPDNDGSQGSDTYWVVSTRGPPFASCSTRLGPRSADAVLHNAVSHPHRASAPPRHPSPAPTPGAPSPRRLAASQRASLRPSRSSVSLTGRCEDRSGASAAGEGAAAHQVMQCVVRLRHQIALDACRGILHRDHETEYGINAVQRGAVSTGRRAVEAVDEPISQTREPLLDPVHVAAHLRRRAVERVPEVGDGGCGKRFSRLGHAFPPHRLCGSSRPGGRPIGFRRRRSRPARHTHPRARRWLPELQ